MNLRGHAPGFYPQLAADAGAPEHVNEFGPLGQVGAWALMEEGTKHRLLVVRRRQPKAVLVVDALYRTKSAARTFLYELQQKERQGTLAEWLDGLSSSHLGSALWILQE